MAQLLSVNVGLPREIEWKGKTVRAAVWKHTVRGRELVLSASDVHLAPRRPLQVEHSNRVTWLYSSRTPRRSKPRRSRWLQGG